MRNKELIEQLNIKEIINKTLKDASYLKPLRYYIIKALQKFLNIFTNRFEVVMVTDKTDDNWKNLKESITRCRNSGISKSFVNNTFKELSIIQGYSIEGVKELVDEVYAIKFP